MCWRSAPPATPCWPASARRRRRSAGCPGFPPSGRRRGGHAGCSWHVSQAPRRRVAERLADFPGEIGGEGGEPAAQESRIVVPPAWDTAPGGTQRPAERKRGGQKKLQAPRGRMGHGGTSRCCSGSAFWTRCAVRLALRSYGSEISSLSSRVQRHELVSNHGGQGCTARIGRQGPRTSF